MSFLAPLYLLAGLGIAAPIVLHLIRRQPKGEVEFSSLMFLDPTPPRLTRRSRLENLPLLILRCLVIAALALAFARPFLPSTQTATRESARPACILLLDQSASMRRDGVWEQAMRSAQNVIDEDSSALISVIAFDERPSLQLGLENSEELSGDSRGSVAKQTLEELRPTWRATNLGDAIRFAADYASRFTLRREDIGDGSNSTRVVLISDLQSGAAIDSLQGYEWPEGVWLDLRPVRPQTAGNLSLRVLRRAALETRTDDVEDQSTLRLRIRHAGDGSASTATLNLDDQTESKKTVQVDVGASLVTSFDLPGTSQQERARLRLTGDQDPFDNTFYFIRPKKARQRVLFVSRQTENADSRETLELFVDQVPWSDATRDVRLESVSEWPGDLKVKLDPTAKSSASLETTTPFCVVDATMLDEASVTKLTSYLRDGGRAVLVLDRELNAAQIDALSDLLQVPELTCEASSDDEFRLVSSIDFDAPIIAPLSQPGTGDFSTVRIWKHQKLSGMTPETSVLLRLDNGSPLLLRRVFEASENAAEPSFPGRLWILTCGWQPSQSQVALSTKFVPLMLGMLGPNRQLPPQSLTVGDPVEEEIARGDDDQSFAEQPGFVERTDGTTVAVNLSSSESETLPLDPDRFSQLGIVTSSRAQQQRDRQVERALRDREIESRQAWWQWLVLATLGFVGAETILAARQSSRVSETAGDADV
ncbi:MAG: BatA domain-containing protein [Planctomycetota bacterium]